MALNLIADRDIDGVSMDTISEVSGISKATIYRHWANKEALCLEAVSRLQSEIPVFDSGDVRTDIVKLLRHLIEAPKSEVLKRIMPKILSHASTNPAFIREWSNRIEEPRRTRLCQLIERAISSGELPAEVDVNLAQHILLGSILYHHMLNTAIPPDMPERIVDSFWRANASTEANT